MPGYEWANPSDVEVVAVPEYEHGDPTQHLVLQVAERPLHRPVIIGSDGPIHPPWQSQLARVLSSAQPTVRHPRLQLQLRTRVLARVRARQSERRRRSALRFVA